MPNRQIGALWSRKSQNGASYFSGTISLGVLGEKQVVVFKAIEKRTENSPDFIVYASTPLRQNGNADAGVPTDDDDLPF